jgi:hypothetical protein
MHKAIWVAVTGTNLIRLILIVVLKNHAKPAQPGAACLAAGKKNAG